MIIVPCCGVCNLGGLSVAAARFLGDDGAHTVIALGVLATGQTLLKPGAGVLAINGCKKICASKVIRGQQREERWQLTISDLGVELRTDGGYTKEDVQLVVDGVEAACTDVGDQVPNNLGSCGCC